MKETMEEENHRNSHPSKEDHYQNVREQFSTRKACQAEVDRVKNTLIIEFKVATEKHGIALSAEMVKDLNQEVKSIKDAKQLNSKDLSWTKLTSPKDGQHKDSIFYRLTITKKFSKKAFFQMMRTHGNGKYQNMSARNEFPAFLKEAGTAADHLGSIIRTMTRKNTKTRTIFNLRAQAIELQITDGTRTANKLNFITIAPSAWNSDTPIPPPEAIARGNQETERILSKVDGYDEIRG